MNWTWSHHYLVVMIRLIDCSTSSMLVSNIKSVSIFSKGPYMYYSFPSDLIRNTIDNDIDYFHRAKQSLMTTKN